VAGSFQIGEKEITAQERFVEYKENPSTFFFIKGRMPAFLPKTYQKAAA
jgi:hypothetical protein